MIEWLHCQFFNETAKAFHLNAIEKNQNEYAECHGQRDVHVSRRNHTQRWQTKQFFTDSRQQIDWQQIHQVHHKHPDEDGQRERCNHFAFAVIHVTYAAVDETNDQFNCGLQFTRDTAGGVFGYAMENNQKEYSEEHGEKHRIDVNRPESRPNLKLSQMVTDILLWSRDFS